MSRTPRGYGAGMGDENQASDETAYPEPDDYRTLDRDLIEQHAAGSLG